MKVGVMQSSYMPWKGYFDLVHSVDKFIFYDDVQYTKNDWRNRNQIKRPDGKVWLSVPVGTDINRKICEVEILEHKWQEKHYKTLKQYYGKCKSWEYLEPWLKKIYEIEWNNLMELNQTIWKDIINILGIEVQIEDSRDYKLEGQKEERLLSLLKQVDCTTYISTPAAKNYIVEEDFRKVGIKVEYTDIKGFPEYNQPYPPFNHFVSVLDLLLCTGPEAPWYIWGWRKESK